MSEEDRRNRKDNICSVLLYTMFPSSDYAIQHQIKKMNTDLHDMYAELKNEHNTFRELRVTLEKLHNKRISMDPNGMSRAEAIKSTRNQMITVKNKMGVVKKQIDFYERSKSVMETTKMTTDADARIGQLANVLRRVHGIDSKRVVANMEDIVEANDQLVKINDTVNDTMVAGWNCDIDAEEAMLDEYLETCEEHDELEDITVGSATNDLSDDDNVLFLEEEGPVVHAPTPAVIPKRKQPVVDYF